MIAALAVSIFALAAFWLVFYGASPLVTAIVIAEALVVIGLAFGVAGRTATKSAEAKLRRE